MGSPLLFAKEIQEETPRSRLSISLYPSAVQANLHGFPSVSHPQSLQMPYFVPQGTLTQLLPAGLLTRARCVAFTKSDPLLTCEDIYKGPD